MEENKEPMEEKSETNTSNSSEAKTAEEGTDSNVSEKEVTEKTAKEDAADDKLDGPKPEQYEKVESPFPELVDYSKLDFSELVKAFKALLKEYEVQFLKTAAEALRTEFFKKIKEDREEKLSKFTEDGSSEEDFEYEHPSKKEFQELWDEFQARKKRRREDIESKLAEGLKQRLALIEEMKGLVEGDEKLRESFQHLREIQDKWKQAGPVPRAKSSEVYSSYHFQLERFYDFVKLNDELRDLDFKKNLEQKSAIIEAAKDLLKEKDIHKAFKELQKLHKRWKEQGGPVAKEYRESLWEEFSSLTQEIHEKRRALVQQEKEAEALVIKEKEAAVSALAEIVNRNINTHQDWQKTMKEVDDIFEKFKKAGHLSPENNQRIWNAFKAEKQKVNHKKNEYYKEQKRLFEGNLERLKVIVTEAETVKDSEDLKETANYLKGLQADWKKVKPVPRKEADKLWKKFRAACDHFFNRIEKENEQRANAFKSSLKARKDFLKEHASLKLPTEKESALAKIKELQQNWKELGPISKSDFQNLQKDYSKLLDGLFEQIDIKKSEQSKIRLQSKVEDKLANEGEDNLRADIRSLEQKLKNEKSQLGKLETNLSFFSSSIKNPLFTEAEKKVKAQQKRVEDLQAEIINTKKILTSLLKSDNEEAES